MFYGGKLKAMPPKLLSDSGTNVLIRPMAYCKEEDIIRFAQIREYPIIPCNLCGSQENLQRQNIKAMCQDWDKQFPGRIESIFRSMANVSLSQLADRNNFDFESLRVSGIPAVNIDVDNAYAPMTSTVVNTWVPNSQ
jgi:tRNA 2-thiocytidine biosynthesis protein TtcA